MLIQPTINHQYIGIIREVNGQLLYEELPVKNNHVLIDKVYNYVNSDDYTLLDLQELVLHNGVQLESTSQYAHLCSYRDSFVDVNKNIIILTEKEYYRRYNNYKSDRHKRYLHSLKVTFAKNVLRRLYADSYAYVTQKIQGDSSIRLYSTESIGWGTFSWKITEDINVLIKTNFCYGTSSYLNIAIKYKNYLLTPFSDYITYYYARAESFIKCTRRYIPCRDNWKKLMLFVIQFSNMITSSPDNFIQNWLIGEFKTLIEGLHDFYNNVDVYLKRIQPNRDERYLKVGNLDAFSNNYITSEERGLNFIAEKISGALLFLRSIFELTLYNEELLPYIKEVIDINNKFMPTLSLKMELLENEVNILKEKYIKVKNDLEKIEKQKSYWDKKAELFLTKEERKKKDEFDYKESSERFKVLFPKYQEIISLYQEQTKRYNSISAEYRGRSSFLSSLQKCKERIVNANNSYNNITIPCVSTIQ